jgi:two-component system, chemotaxis family, chemotaxis protein CheY
MILIVDDDAASAENCSMLLELYGYEVKTALGGKEALSVMETNKLDLLISDCNMPGMSGSELSNIITDLPRGAPFPILLMSSDCQSVAAPGEGYDAFMRKPFLAEKLLSEVRRLLGTSLMPLASH